jgi:HlyD family secretion protein
MVILGIALISGGFAVYKHLLGSNQSFMYAGTLDTTKVTISSKVATDIIYFPNEEGDRVKKGDAVAKLNDEHFRIASQQVDADFERCRVLRKGKVISQADFDKIKRAKEENDLSIRNCEVKAPIDGIIVTKFKQCGEYLSPGSSIVSIVNPSNIWAYFYVPYDIVYKLKVGDEVNGFLQEASGKVFKGIIVKINEEAEFTPKNVQTREERTRLIFGVKVRFENKDLELKPGMTVETDFAQ